MRKTFFFVVALLACATIAAYPSADSSPRLSLSATACEAPTDTTVVTVSWDIVSDRRGNPVAFYEWRLNEEPATLVAGDSTQGTDAQAPILCPQYGDTARYYAEVWAVDTRGNAGARGRSATLALFTPDPGPEAPTVRIDTIAVGTGEGADSLTLVFVDAEVAGVADRYYSSGGHLNIGDVMQGCPVWWHGDVATLDSDYALLCGNATGAEIGRVGQLAWVAQ